jgi:hypothetical protein
MFRSFEDQRHAMELCNHHLGLHVIVTELMHDFCNSVFLVLIQFIFIILDLDSRIQTFVVSERSGFDSEHATVVC